MKYFLIFLAFFVYVALAQDQPSEGTTTAAPPVDEGIRRPLPFPWFIFRQFLPQFRPFILPYAVGPDGDEPRGDEEFKQVGNPFEYQFNDRFSVQPFLTFPPNAGGGLNFRYRF